jgi:hypothetical protein
MSLLLATPAAGAAHGEEGDGVVVRRLYFDLPAQPLDKALSEFGALTGHSVLVDSVTTQGRTTRAVRGTFEPEEALRQMVQGTGLALRFSGRQAFTLMPEPATTYPTLPAANILVLPGPASAPLLSGLPAATAADFAGALQAAITKAMCAAQPEHMGRYRAALQLWIAQDGRIRQARLLESSGLKSRDAQLLAQLKGLAVGRVPPPELAQPLTILLSPKPDPAATCRLALGEGP